jgi:uncharacterized protein YqjF (DUF2071 family)
LKQSAKKTFLTAEWRKLIMANYRVDPTLLRPYLPAGTESDQFSGYTYVSLVGFMFREVRIKGLSIPFHTEFPEVNLRCYVRVKDGNAWKRGVVFLSEIVPKPAIAWVANTLYQEHYSSMPMRHYERQEAGQLRTGYEWKYKGRWNSLAVGADIPAIPLQAGSKEEFITEHFWGYSSGKNQTTEYQVAHPRWDIYTVKDFKVDCDFVGLYGQAFAGLASQQPDSVFLAEGSAIQAYGKKVIDE